MIKRNSALKTARFISRNQRRGRGGTRNVFISHNFSDVEDGADAFRIIRNLAAHAGNNAAAEAKAAGLSRVYIRNNELIKVSAT